MSLNYFYTGAPPHGIIKSRSVVQVSIHAVEVSITVLPVARTFDHTVVPWATSASPFPTYGSLSLN